MVRRIWLIFAQATTLALAALFVVLTFKPHWVANLGSGSEPAGSGELGLREGGSPIAAHSYREAAARAMPAVVYIYTTQKVAVPNHPLLNDPTFRKFFRDQPEREPTAGLGSGVIVSEKGYVLTNHHVVSGAEQIEVGLADGRRAGAILVGTDPDTDLAVLKISLNRLPVIAFGRPTEARVGDTVLAIGNPFGVGQTVTQGIISAMGRSRLGINTYENFIQTDAAINPGNSGGALIDTQGQLLGINTAIYSRNGAPGSLGIGFATPISTARSVLEQIVRDGSVTRGYIGVEPQDLSPELVEAFKLARRQGALIMSVIPNGPADRGGVRAGDILVAVQGQPIHGTAAMLNAIAQLAPGSRAKLGLV